MSNVRVSPVTSPKRDKEAKKDEDDETNFSYSPLSSAVSSPSKSNVNDFYTGSPSSHGSRQSSDSPLRDPPPPYSSPSRSEVSKSSNSRYSNLMQFLDKEIENTKLPSSVTNENVDKDEYGNDENVSTFSSMSDLSPNSKSRPDDSRSYGNKSSNTGRTYIWDEDMSSYGQKDEVEKTTHSGNEVGSGEVETYFSSRRGSSKNMEDTIAEIKKKVEEKQSELREVTKKTKELQAELVRVTTARKRRTENCETNGK